jgi:hypothetical protein
VSNVDDYSKAELKVRQNSLIRPRIALKAFIMVLLGVSYVRGAYQTMRRNSLTLPFFSFFFMHIKLIVFFF